MGRHGDAPFYYRVYRAAKVLNCSFLELSAHEDCLTLMTMAFAIERGENEGEYLKEKNPEYQRQRKQMTNEMVKARGK